MFFRNSANGCHGRCEVFRYFMIIRIAKRLSKEQVRQPVILKTNPYLSMDDDRRASFNFDPS
jgi:hypothetical protein